MGSRLRLTALAALGIGALAASIACGDLVRQGRSPTILVVDFLRASSGAEAALFGGNLTSDVVTNVTRTIGGVEQLIPTVYADVGSVQVRILMKDQGAPGTLQVPSNLNAVQIDRYRVVYRRTDGRNTPGVDVPYPFDGAVTATVTSTPIEVTFTIVRVQAKVEPPLLALRGNGGRIFISAIADVTLYGHDLAGNDVASTGSISINFADWGDPT